MGRGRRKPASFYMLYLLCAWRRIKGKPCSAFCSIPFESANVLRGENAEQGFFA